MISATFTESGKKLSLRVEGHAGYAEPNHDIVCASASILAYTFAVTIMELDDVGEADRVIEITSGDTLVECECKTDEVYQTVLGAFRYTKLGYKLLEHNYPQYVRLNAST